MKLLSQTEYAEHLGISRQAVNRMIHDGRIPHVHGRIDAEAADRALANNSTNGDSMPLAEALRRKEAALAGLRELELATKSGEAVAISDVCNFLAQNNSIVRMRLLQMPSKLGPQLPVIEDMRRRIVEIMREEVRECLEELSNDLPSLVDFRKWHLCESCKRLLRGERVRQVN